MLGPEPDRILAAVVVTGSVDALADTVLLAGLRLRQTLGLLVQLTKEERLSGVAGPTFTAVDSH